MTVDGQDRGDSPGSGERVEEHPPAPGRRSPTPALSLSDPLSDRAGEDTPEAWGDPAESEADRDAQYQRERPPHHGA